MSAARRLKIARRGRGLARAVGDIARPRRGEGGEPPRRGRGGATLLTLGLLTGLAWLLQNPPTQTPPVFIDAAPVQPTYPLLPPERAVNSCFGLRQDPMGGAGLEQHDGVDLRAADRTRVQAVLGGVVVAASRDGGYGLRVLLYHGCGLRTLYAHLDALSTDLPATGAAVRRSQLIGYTGQSGRATGPHLHFEVHRGGVPVDSLPLLLAADDALEHDCTPYTQKVEGLECTEVNRR